MIRANFFFFFFVSVRLSYGGSSLSREENCAVVFTM